MDEFHDLLRRVFLEDSKTTRRELTLSFITSLASLDPHALDLTQFHMRIFEIVVDASLAHPSSDSRRRALLALLEFFCEEAPATVADLLCARTSVLERFFRSSDRLLAWFGAMRASGQHAAGALALTQFALAHRDRIWDALQWTGKHPQAPSQCVQKPHYFCELDVEASVRALVDREGARFWQSEQVQGGLRQGGLVLLDARFFAEELRERLQDGRDGIRDALRAFLPSAPLRPLLRRLLPLLKDPDLLDLTCSLQPRPAPAPALPLWTALLSLSPPPRSLGDFLVTFQTLTAILPPPSSSAAEKLQKGAKKLLKSVLGALEAAGKHVSPGVWTAHAAAEGAEGKVQRFGLLRYAVQLRLGGQLEKGEHATLVDFVRRGLGIPCAIVSRPVDQVEEGQSPRVSPMTGRGALKRKRRQGDEDEEDPLAGMEEGEDGLLQPFDVGVGEGRKETSGRSAGERSDALADSESVGKFVELEVALELDGGSRREVVHGWTEVIRLVLEELDRAMVL